MDINKICIKCMKEVREGTVCPTCGRDINAPYVQGHCLRPYTILNGKYLIGDVIGEGGFGITYVGLDLNLESKIAIKEFFPSGQVSRDNTITTTVTMFANANQDAVKKWRDSFVKEAQALSKCSHFPGIVGVRDFFHENETAYIVMEFVEGQEIKKYVKQRGGKLAPDELFRMIEPVMNSLQKVHETGVIHRDISPDNIMIENTGEVKLIDFGAARSFGNEDEKSKSIMLKPGYAPPEQYFTKGNQGPWSDVYALAATLYKCLTGKTPSESMERLRVDSMKSPMELGVPISPATNAVIMKALAVYEDNRYRSMKEFHDALYGSLGGQPAPQPPVQPAPAYDSAEDTEDDNAGTNLFDVFKKNPIYGVLAGVAVLFLIMLIVMVGGGNKHNSKSQKTEIPEYDPQEIPVVNYGYLFEIQYIKKDKAKKACEEKGGSLLSIDSVEEYNMLKECLRQVNEREDLGDVVFWIGADNVTDETIATNDLMLYYDAANDEIKWVDRSEVDPMDDMSGATRIGYIFEPNH